jgi:hypothetical protein
MKNSLAAGWQDVGAMHDGEAYHRFFRKTPASEIFGVIETRKPVLIFGVVMTAGAVSIRSISTDFAPNRRSSSPIFFSASLRRSSANVSRPLIVHVIFIIICGGVKWPNYILVEVLQPISTSPESPPVLRVGRACVFRFTILTLRPLNILSRKNHTGCCCVEAVKQHGVS